MIDVSFSASSAGIPHLDDIARGLERHLRFAPRHSGADAACLHLTSRRLPGPFVVNPQRGVVVSTWESGGVCGYTGIGLDDYLLIASLLALTQWRVLRGNPLLRIEDLRHPPEVHCLFAGPHSVQDFALLLDPPIACGGCADFYHCLGADSELIALRQVIANVLASQTYAAAKSTTRRN